MLHHAPLRVLAEAADLQCVLRRVVPYMLRALPRAGVPVA